MHILWQKANILQTNIFNTIKMKDYE